MAKRIKDNIIHLKLIEGGKNPLNDEIVFTQGVIYGQYVLISQINNEFEESDIHTRSKDLFAELVYATKDRSIKLSKELKIKIEAIRKTFKEKQNES